MASDLLLALLLGMQPDPAALIPLYRENAARAERVYGATDPRARQAQRDLAVYLSRNGSRLEAARLLRRVAETEADFALLAELVPAAEAAAILREALTIAEREHGPASPRVALRLNDLALAQAPRAAEPLLRRAVRINEAALGPDHVETAVTVFNLADMLARQNRFREAEPLAARAVAVFATKLGEANTRTKEAREVLAAIQRAGRSGSPR